MKDRFSRGFTAGVIGGMASAVYNYFAGVAGLSTLTATQWIAIFLYAHTPPFSFGEIIFAYLGQIFVGGMLGVGFAFWLPYVTSRNLLLKGWMFSVTFWFAVYAIATLFQLPGTVPTPLQTTLSNFISTTIYGLTLAFALRALVRQEKPALNRITAAPAMKPLDNEDDANNS